MEQIIQHVVKESHYTCPIGKYHIPAQLEDEPSEDLSSDMSDLGENLRENFEEDHAENLE